MFTQTNRREGLLCSYRVGPLPLLVGNIGSGRGLGGCKSLIQTHPPLNDSRQLDWVGLKGNRRHLAVSMILFSTSSLPRYGG